MYTAKGASRIIALTLLISQSDVLANDYFKKLQQFTTTYITPTLKGVSKSQTIVGIGFIGLAAVYRWRDKIAKINLTIIQQQFAKPESGKPFTVGEFCACLRDVFNLSALQKARSYVITLEHNKARLADNIALSGDLEKARKDLSDLQRKTNALFTPKSPIRPRTSRKSKEVELSSSLPLSSSIPQEPSIPAISLVASTLDSELSAEHENNGRQQSTLSEQNGE